MPFCAVPLSNHVCQTKKQFLRKILLCSDHLNDKRSIPHNLLHLQHFPGLLLPHQSHPRHCRHVLRRVATAGRGRGGQVRTTVIVRMRIKVAAAHSMVKYACAVNYLIRAFTMRTMPHPRRAFLTRKNYSCSTRVSRGFLRCIEKAI